MLVNVVKLILSLAVILMGAEIFTNGVEWLGKKLKLSEGAVGSLLAAVGTALPETMIPVIAILFGTSGGEAGGHGGGHEIGIGAILGAPFMLSTLAMFVSGMAVIYHRKKRGNYPVMNVNPVVMERDLKFFLIVYSIAILAAFLPTHNLKMFVIIFLVAAYGYYVYLTLTDPCPDDGDEEHLAECYFDKVFTKSGNDPVLGIIITQVIFALGLIVLGANFFVQSIGFMADVFGVPAFVLSLIIAPIATELPEKFNSVIWIAQGKDTLALGNITGAMVFQSSLIPALGIALTDWNLTTGALISAVLAIASSLIIYSQLKMRNVVTPYTLVIGGVFYLVFISMVFLGLIH
ncbi:MAG: membrane protein [Peptococcaceae bacterium BICA1-8]|nr:MAG: membrane protein [Peptococcaceae bacterium BICA1-8]